MGIRLFGQSRSWPVLLSLAFRVFVCFKRIPSNFDREWKTTTTLKQYELIRGYFPCNREYGFNSAEVPFNILFVALAWTVFFCSLLHNAHEQND